MRVRVLFERWVVADETWHMIAWPFATIGGLTGVSLIGYWTDILPSPYASTYVGAVGLVANRVCVRAGLIAATLAVLTYNGLFSQEVHFGFRWPTSGEVTAYVTMFVLAVTLAPRAAKLPKAEPKSNPDTPLPFVNRTGKNGHDNGLHGNGAKYWDVCPSGNWVEDCAVGDEYARLFINSIRRHDDGRPLVSWIVRDMVVGGRFSGVEAGFIQRLGRSSTPGLAVFNNEHLFPHHTPDDERLHRSV